MDHTHSHGPSDSGLGTRAPSVASRTLQSGCANQDYPVQSYISGCQLSQQDATYSYGNQRSSDSGFAHAAYVSSSKHKRGRRLR